MTAKKGSRKIRRKELGAIEREAKREAQKAAGALDGRFRVKVIPNKKRKVKRKGGPDIDQLDQ